MRTKKHQAYQNATSIKMKGSLVISISKNKDRFMGLLKDGDKTTYKNECKFELKNNA